MILRRIRRQAMTLVELLIVIGIMAVLSGFISINVVKAVREQRFRSEVSRLVQEMRLAQELMLILKVGSTLKFSVAQNGSGIQYWLETELPIPKRWEALIRQEKPPLQAIKVMQFQDAKEAGKLEINFLSEEVGMSKGVLRLSTSERDSDLGTLTTYVCLPGYPSPIEYKNGAQDSAFCKIKENEQFLNTLSRLIYEQITDLQGVPAASSALEGKEEATDAS